MVSVVCESFHAVALPVVHVPTGFCIGENHRQDHLTFHGRMCEFTAFVDYSLGQRLCRALPLESCLYFCANPSLL